MRTAGKKSAESPETSLLESIAADCAAVRSVVVELLDWQSGRLPEALIERLRGNLRRKVL
jgi:hypothetical protein